MIRVNFQFNSKKEAGLLREVDETRKKIYSSRSRFIKLALRNYLNWLKRRENE